MRRHLVILVLIILVAALAYHFANPDQAPVPPPSAASPIVTPPPPIESHAQVPKHVIKLGGAEQRRALADRIAAANAAQGAHAAPAAPKLPDSPSDDTHDLERLSVKSADALEEVIPFLADCYRAADRAHDGGVSKTAAAFITMRGARGVGTLIDADQLLDADQQSLDPELVSCLKTTLESLELPPLAEGDTIKLQYSFKFGDP